VSKKNKNETELDLNKEYKLAKTRVETLFKGKELRQYMDTLTEAQRAWLKYRDNDCKLALYAADKGSDLSNANISM